jgi:hypothetical protein
MAQPEQMARLLVWVLATVGLAARMARATQRQAAVPIRAAPMAEVAEVNLMIAKTLPALMVVLARFASFGPAIPVPSRQQTQVIFRDQELKDAVNN